MTIRHAFISPKGDDADETLVRPSNWNAVHVDAAGNIIYPIVSNPGPGQYRILNIRLSADFKIVVTYDDTPMP